MQTPAEDDWAELSVLVPPAWAELAAQHLGAPPASPAALQQLPEGVLVRSWLPAAQATPVLRLQCEQALATALRAAGARGPAARVELRRTTPAELSAPAWRAFRVGRICIVPPGERPALGPDDLVLELEPGAAFGTGRHATTRTCLRALQAHAVAGLDVLDLGCGTGLLGLAAARLGAAAVRLLDDDPLATACAGELARANGLDAVCTLITGDLSAAARERPADLLLANLEGPLLCARAAELAGLLRPGGRFVVSGIKASDEARVTAALGAAGLPSDASRGTPRWRALLGQRVDASP